MPTVSNEEFLTAIFADDAPWTHVTDFSYDPGNIPADKHLAAWAGDFYCRYRFGQQTNQYFTISHFYVDDQDKARRRKALYRHTRVIVLDDVREKLAMGQVDRLPSPSWILETSPGSEQWGYILDRPCTDRARVENLLDGLVANGLAPEGRDPGMKGVTRYVRLPEGYNLKAAKMVNGQPYKCRMLVWNPFTTSTLESLAAPFHVDLDATRREQRVDGASNIPDHPLLQLGDLIQIKDVRSNGRFDITCPWVSEHTHADDSGAGMFTNDDGSIGFKCHHGACQHRTGRDLLNFIGQHRPEFGMKFAAWKAIREFSSVPEALVPSFMEEPSAPAPAAVTQSEPSFMGDVAAPVQMPAPTIEEASDGLMDLLDQLRREPNVTSKAREYAKVILKSVEELPEIDKKQWHVHVCDHMGWSKPDFKEILKDLRSEWYTSSHDLKEFYQHTMHIGAMNRMYNWSTGIFYTREGFQNSYADQDGEAAKNALEKGLVTKVDLLDYAPKMPRVFQEKGITYGNAWTPGDELTGSKGDASPWIDHFDVLGWGEHRKHILQWMAFTILHPEVKINHMLIMGSMEGGGKDFLLYPLIYAMGRHAKVINGEDLLSDFNDYLQNTKYLHVNETELGDRREAISITSKLKPIATAPPMTLRVNPKGVGAFDVRNIVNGTMTTNSRLPLRLTGPSRRFYAVWSDMNTRDSDGEMTPEWRAYWSDRWKWMQSGGVEYCVWYLRNMVDLSDFNPGAAPRVTDFLRDIQDDSKSPMQQTVESFVRRRIGAFRSDLVTASDAAVTLKAGEIVAPDLMNNDGHMFTPRRCAQILRDMSDASSLRVRGIGYDMKVWAIRDLGKYINMTPAELGKEYERQICEARQHAGPAPLTVVK